MPWLFQVLLLLPTLTLALLSEHLLIGQLLEVNGGDTIILSLKDLKQFTPILGLDSVADHQRIIEDEIVQCEITMYT